jgi:hypothetical protein
VRTVAIETLVKSPTIRPLAQQWLLRGAGVGTNALPS